MQRRLLAIGCGELLGFVRAAKPAARPQFVAPARARSELATARGEAEMEENDDGNARGLATPIGRPGSPAAKRPRRGGGKPEVGEAAEGAVGRAAVPAAGRPRTQAESGLPGYRDLREGAWVLFEPSMLDEGTARAAFAELEASLPWESRDSTMRAGIKQPRLITYQADGPELVYTYSRTRMVPNAWHPAVLAIKEACEAALEGAAGAPAGRVRFNSCLLNLYRDGKDNMYWHSDNEPLYGRNPTIASVSLGTEREFIIRRIDDHSSKISYSLPPGSLLVMGGTMQVGWQHSLPRRAKAGPRINLTFRTVVHLEQPSGDSQKR